MFKLIYKNSKSYKLITVLGPFFKLLEAIIELFIPLVVAEIIDTGIKNLDKAYVFKMSGIMLMLYIVGFGFSITCQYFASLSAFGVGANLKSAVFKHVNNLPLSTIEKYGASTLVMRVNADCTNVQTALNRFIRLVTRSPFILIGALIMAMRINLKLSLIFFAVSVCVAFSLFLVLKLSAPKIKKINASNDQLTLKTRESLSGARVIRAFNKQGHEEGLFNKTSNELSRESVVLGAVSALTNPLTYLFINLAVVLILYLGAETVNTGALERGQIIALINYLSQILNALVIIATLVVIFAKATASAKRINEVLNEPAEASQDFSSGDERNENGGIALEFKNVSALNVLKNISFSLKEHQTLGIIGGTGSGKTVLISLIARLYAYSGTITLFNKDLKDYGFNELRSVLAVADQKAALVSGSVRDNMLISRSATDEQITEALNICSCDFITTLSAVVSRGGTNFSGGQRQRLSLARAVLKDCPMIIIDDGMSALDYATERRIKRKLSKLKTTKVIVSQRISGISDADLIIVLEAGEIAGIGTNQELLRDCPVYQEINQIQQGGAQ